MKILLCLTILLVAATAQAFPQKRQSERQFACLFSKVHIVKEYRSHTVNKPEPLAVSELMKERPYKISTFAEDGALAEEDGRYSPRFTFSYDERGMKIKTANDDISPGSGRKLESYIAQQEIEKFDTRGNKVEVIAFLQDDDTPWFRETYEYDLSHCLTKKSIFWRDQKKQLKVTKTVAYYYYESGGEREIIWQDVTGQVIDQLLYSDYKYDLGGNWLERKESRAQVYDKDQPKIQVLSYVYRTIIYY